MKTFSVLVDEAVARAKAAAAPFVPSRAQLEAELQRHVVDSMLVMEGSEAAAFVQQSYRGAGTVDALAVELYKQQVSLYGDTPVSPYKRRTKP